MGNTELKTAFKTALKDQQSKEKLGLTAEILLEDSLVTCVEEYIKEKMVVANIDKDKAFPENNIQTNENSEDIYKKQLISELNENYISGFGTAQSTIESLKEPSFEKYFTVQSPQSITDYQKLQQQKFVILYALFVEKYRQQQQDKKQNFQEYIQKFLEKSDLSSRTQVGIEGGFKFSLSLLREIKEINKDMLLNSLEYLYQTLRYTEQGSLYSTDKLSFMIDQNLNDARSFLISIIEDSKSNPRSVELSFKIIFLLGLVRSNVEDLLIFATLLEKYKPEIDISQEFQMLKEDDNDEKYLASDLLKKEYQVRKQTKQGTIFYLKSGLNKTVINDKATFACDGTYIYMHQEGLGIVKIGTGAQGKMMGQVFQHNPQYKKEEQVFLMCLNNKIYCRAESLKPRPFALINPITLEEEKDEIELEKEEQNLEWKESEDMSRSLTYTPLITDGNYIYVVALKKIKKEKNLEENKENDEAEQQDKDDNNKPPLMVIECYDAATPSLKFVNEIILYKNQDFEPFVKQKNTIDFIKQNSFATNGQLFLIQREKKVYFFDLKTGILIKKYNLYECDQSHKLCFDFQNNQFYHFKTKVPDIKIEAFNIQNFRKVNFSFGFEKLYLSNRLKTIKENILGNEANKNDKSKVDPSKYNLIQKIMKSVTTPTLIKHNRETTKLQIQIKNSAQNIRTLILGQVNKSCTQFKLSLDEIRLQNKSHIENEEHNMQFFKYPNATYLTNNLFQTLGQNLQSCQSLIDSKKNNENLPQQYSFYFILNILAANFQALSFCSITLPDIMDEEDYQQFLGFYKQCIVKIIENGYKKDFEEGDLQDEMKLLWVEIHEICLNILSNSINLIYTNTKDIINNIINQLKDVSNDKQIENCSISLNFLSTPENCKNLITNELDDISLITNLFELCCQLKSKDLIQTIETNKMENINLDDHQERKIMQSCNKFIREMSEQLIVQYCTLYETIGNKQILQNQKNAEKDEQDKKRLKEYEHLLTLIFSNVANELGNQIKSLAKSLKQQLEQKSDEELNNIQEQYYIYTQLMNNMFQHHSAFYQIITLYVQTFSVFKIKTQLLPSITSTLTTLVNDISQYYLSINKFEEKLKVDKDKDKLKQFINQFSRNICWFIGMTAYKFIKIKDSEKDQDKESKEIQNEKIQDLIIQSNLLSGGIENRFVTQFSPDVQQQLQDLIKISYDSQLQQLLNSKGEDKQQDNLLNSIIFEEKNEIVDRVISYLQQALERKIPFVPYARLGGKDGMRLSRASFSVMIKFSEFFDDFQIMVDEIDLKWEELQGDEERDIKIKEFIKCLPHYEQIAKRWENASKMRLWINEKKKNLMERVKKEVEQLHKNKKQEDLDKQINLEQQQKEKEKAQKEEEEKVEIINTSEIKEKVEQIIDQSLSEADKTIIDDESEKVFTLNLQKIFDKIIEKAQFLIKLQVAAVYLFNDPSKKKEGTLLFIQDQHQEEGQENQTNEPELDWKDRLRSWKQMQTSKGAIKSFTERKKEIFDSSVMSVLACLQTPISAQRIKKQVESVFLNACKRNAGLKILGQVIGLELPQQLRDDLINWFCSSLRGNKNQLSHYLDDIKGCGHHLEDQARENFFTIIKGLVKYLKDSNDEQEVKLILNSLKWKFQARDHAFFKNLEIFKILHEGNGQQNNKLKKAWGRDLKQKVLSCESDKSLTKEVIDLFEAIFILTVGRIVKPDTGSLMKLKQSGTSIPTLEKAMSVIDVNVSENLIAQAFDVIFQEFKRYIKIMKIFKGIDWSTYVKMRNKFGKKEEEKQNQDDDDKFLDEEEQQDDEEYKIDDEEEAEEQKQQQPSNDNSSISQEQQVSEQQIKQQNDMEKENLEAVKQLNERSEKQIKTMQKLYSESFLRRLLRLVEIFTSIATISPYPLSMVQRVANPYQLETLFNLLILSSPKIKIIVLKVIQNLIKISIPFEVFEETITIITRDQNSIAYEILNKVIPTVQFEESKFLKFLYNYMISVRHKMWTKSGIESEGQYAVTQEIQEVFRYILCHNVNQNWHSYVNDKLVHIISQLNTISLEEIDIWLSFLPGADFNGIRMGQLAVTKHNQKVLILGFSDTWKGETQVNGMKDIDFEKIHCTMDDQGQSKVLALFLDYGDQDQRQEVIQLAINEITPIQQSYNCTLLEKKEIQSHFLDYLCLEQKGNINCIEKIIQQDQIKVQILKAFQYQIQSRGQEYLNILKSNGFLESFIDQIFKRSSEVCRTDDTQLPIVWLEMKCYLFRLRALQTSESLGSVDEMSATIQDKKYIAFRGQEQKSQIQGAFSYPIAGAINIQTILKNQVYSCKLDRDIQILSKNYEMIVVDPALFESNPQKAFTLMMHSYITVISEKIDIQQLFIQMRKISNKQPSLFKGLAQKVVIQIEQQDFEELYDQKQPIIEFARKKTNSKIKNGPMKDLCQDLLKWGRCSQELSNYIEELEDKSNFEQIKQSISQCLDPKIFQKLQEKAQKKNKLVESKDQIIQGYFRAKSMISSEDEDFNDLGNEQLNSVMKYIDIQKNNVIWRKLEYFIEQYLIPFEEKNNAINAILEKDHYKIIMSSVNQCKGTMMQKEYQNTLSALNLLISRQTFLTILEHADLSSLLPHILEQNQNKRLFASFIKIQFNEAVKMHVGNKKQFQKLLKKIIYNLSKIDSQDENSKQFLDQFYQYQVILPSFQSLEKIKEINDKTIIQQEYLESEELAFKFASPRLFKFMTKLIMKNQPLNLLKNAQTLPNVLNLALSYSLYLSQHSSKLKQKYLLFSLDLVYFIYEHYQNVKMESLESIVNNKLIKIMGEKLKNDKENNETNQSQKIVTEIYLKLIDLHRKIQQDRKKIDCNLSTTRYLSSLLKAERIVFECEQGRKFSMLQYLLFFGSMDKEFLQFLNASVETSHNMFNAPVLAYKKLDGIQRMKINIKATTKLAPFSRFSLTTDREGQNVIQYVSSENLIENISIDLYRNDFYLHYPAQSNFLIGFGSQDGGKLGNGKSQGSTLPTVINLPFLSKSQVKDVASCRNYVMILDSNDEIHLSGNLRGIAQRDVFKLEKLPNSVRVHKFAYGKYNIIVQGEDQHWYVIGRNRLGHFANDSANFDSFQQISTNMEAIQHETIVTFKSGTHFTVFVSDNGKIFARGNEFLSIINIQGDNQCKQITLPDNFIVKEVYCTQSKKRYPMCIIEIYDTIDKRRKFYSAGKNEHGVLGQGTDVKESRSFQPLKMDFEILQFQTISLYEKIAMGITKDGQLYGWGFNEKGMLGLEGLDGVYWQPTLIAYFKEFYVHKALCSFVHSIVEATPRKGGQGKIKNNANKRIYTMGRPDDFTYIGVPQDQNVEGKNIWHLQQFDQLNIQKLATGQRSTFLFVDNSEQYQDLKSHHISEDKSVQGILHFYFQNGQITYVSEQDFQDIKAGIPDITFAIKYPIQNIETKSFPDLEMLAPFIIDMGDFSFHDGIKDDVTKDDIIGARYYTKSNVSTGNIKVVNLSEDSFFSPNEHDIDPLIYIRFAKPISQEVDLPTFNISDFYDQTEHYGIDIEIIPNYKKDVSQTVIDFGIELYNQQNRLLSYYNPQKMRALKDYIESLQLMDLNDLNIGESLKDKRILYQSLDNKDDDVEVAKIIDPKYKSVLEAPEESYELIKKILISQCKYFIRFMNATAMARSHMISYEKYGWHLYLNLLKKEMLSPVKRKIINKMIESLQQTGEGEVTIMRRKAFYFKNSGQVDHEGKFTIFGQIFQQLKASMFTSLKKNKVDSKAFNVTFKGEGSQDAGGPYRDTLTNMCGELQSECLPILIKTPNNKNNHGQNRECFMPNPSAKSPAHLEMFQFFGALIGYAIRTTSALHLDLPPIFWKNIIKEPLDLHSLKEIDTYSWQVIEDLKSQFETQRSQEEFEADVDQHFVTLLSDGTEHELCFRGRDKKVTQENLNEYIELIIKARLEEFDKQMESIRDGIHLIIPEQILFFMTWQELEVRATGKKTCDIALLKKYTKYEGCDLSHAVVKQFWNVMETLTEEEKSMYLKFVWGRSRLPLNMEGLNRNHCVEYYRSRPKDSLPISHTCFFRIDLPDYTDEVILKKRLVYAIEFCGDIDADRGRNDIADEES